MIKKRLNSEKKWNTFLKNYQSHFDYSFEMSGFSKNFSRSISLAKPKGKVLWLGNIDKDLNLPKEI